MTVPARLCRLPSDLGPFLRRELRSAGLPAQAARPLTLRGWGAFRRLVPLPVPPRWGAFGVPWGPEPTPTYSRILNPPGTETPRHAAKPHVTGEYFRGDLIPRTEPAFLGDQIPCTGGESCISHSRAGIPVPWVAPRLVDGPGAGSPLCLHPKQPSPLCDLSGALHEVVQRLHRGLQLLCGCPGVDLRRLNSAMPRKHLSSS